MLPYLLSILFLSTCLHSGDITTPPTQITTTAYALTEGGVTCCFIESKNQVFYTWVVPGPDEAPNKPFFALFDALKDTWIIEKQAIVQTYEDGVNIGTSCCYNSAANQVIICWADSSEDTVPRYVIYDVATQSFQQIQQIEGASSNCLVTCCYNKTANKVIFSWKSNTDYLAVYTLLSSDGSMSEPQTLSGTYPKSSVYCCSTNSNKVVFSYSNSDSDSVLIDVLDLTSKTVDEKELNPEPNVISSDVFSSYNSDKNQVFLSWASNPNENYWKPYFAIFDIATLSFLSESPKSISNTTYEISSTPPINVYSCYSKFDKKVYFSWGANKFDGGVYFAIYDTKISDFSTPATPIGQDYAIGIYSYGVYLCTGLNKVFFTWANLEGAVHKQPWYAVYSFYMSLPKAIQKFSPIKFQR